MGAVLFIIVLIASFIIVRIGAIAFQLTGLEWSLAKFQSLSCFSGTGFTTKEAELITGDPRRRRIASILIIFGNAGLVTMIATVASALNPEQALIARFSESFLPFSIPAPVVPWINLTVIILGLLVIYKISTNRTFAGKITRYLRKRIRKKGLLKPVSFEELLFLTGGYGISRIEVSENSQLIDKTLIESDLRKKDITVLAIVRGSETIPNPTALVTIHKGDELLAFGKLENIRNKIGIA
jgi:Trk-type K+ transport system membrane component